MDVPRTQPVFTSQLSIQCLAEKHQNQTRSYLFQENTLGYSSNTRCLLRELRNTREHRAPSMIDIAAKWLHAVAIMQAEWASRHMTPKRATIAVGTPNVYAWSRKRIATTMLMIRISTRTSRLRICTTTVAPKARRGISPAISIGCVKSGGTSRIITFSW